MTSIARIKRDPRVEVVDDEREIGNGVIVTLRKGFTWDPMSDNRVQGEETVHEMSQSLKIGVFPFEGPFDD